MTTVQQEDWREIFSRRTHGSLPHLLQELAARLLLGEASSNYPGNSQHHPHTPSIFSFLISYLSLYNKLSQNSAD